MGVSAFQSVHKQLSGVRNLGKHEWPHTMTISDIATSAWLIDFCHKAIISYNRVLSLEKSFRKFYGRYQDLIEKYQRSVNVMVSDSFPG